MQLVKLLLVHTEYPFDVSVADGTSDVHGYNSVYTTDTELRTASYSAQLVNGVRRQLIRSSFGPSFSARHAAGSNTSNNVKETRHDDATTYPP